MDIEPFVANYTEADSKRICFNWNGKQADGFKDLNRESRREVYRYFKAHKASVPLLLIRDMYKAEIEYGREAWVENSLVITELAQELLSRGGVQYLDDYIDGLLGNKDTYLALRKIELTKEQYQYLGDECTRRAEDPKYSDKKSICEFVAELFYREVDIKNRQQYRKPSSRQ